MMKILLSLLLSSTALATSTGTLNGDQVTSTDKTKTWVMPNAGGTISCIACTESLSNKTLVAPALGTPASGVATNLTGTATGLTCGNVTTNANLTGGVTSVGNAATVVTNANLTGDATSVGNATTVVKINGTSMAGLATGILKNTTSTGVPSIAVAGDFPTLNQNTSGTAAIATQVTATATSTNTSFYLPFTSGATTSNYGLGLDSGLSYNPSTHTLTTTTLVGALTGTASGNLQGTASNHGMLISGSGNTVTILAPDASTSKVWTSGGASADPSWQAAPVSTTLTTKGDLQTFTTVNARHAVPADGGFMVADSSQTDGWRNNTYIQLGGKPGKNYIQYAAFENNATTGWLAVGCATVTNGLPACVGSGAAAFSSSNGGRAKNANTNAPAIDSSSALAETYALNLATTGAGAIGDGYVSSAYTIDAEDQAKVLSFKVYYKVASGTPVMSGTSANTYAVAVYDVANNAWLGVQGAFNFTQSSGAGYATGTVQTASNTTSLQLFLYSPVAPTGTSSLLIDDVYLGPQTAPMGPAMTDWVAFTPTGTWSTNTTYTGWWKREGDSLSMIVKVALAGAPTSAALSVNLPTGFTIDTSKLPATPANQAFAGSLYGSGAGHSFIGRIFYGSTTSLNLDYILDGSTVSIASVAGITQAAPYTFANADVVEIQVKGIPIVGWSSNTSMSSDTDTRVVAAQMTGATASITGSYSDVTWTTVVSDTHGAMGAINYTVPVTGYYDFTGATSVGATSLSAAGGFFVSLFNTTTSTTLRESQFIFDLNVPENESIDFNYQSIYLTAGTQVKIQIKTTGTVGTPVINSSATLNYLGISRKSGPAVIAATESVNFSVTTSTTAATTSAPFLFTVINKDTHSGYAAGTGKFTAPVTGFYHFEASVFTGGTQYLTLNKNGTIIEQSFPATGATIAKISTNVQMSAGDTMEVRPSASVTASGGAVLNQFAGFRVGN